jgi:hypothetical protein
MLNQGCQVSGHARSQTLYKMRPNFTKRGQTTNFSKSLNATSAQGLPRPNEEGPGDEVG